MSTVNVQHLFCNFKLSGLFFSFYIFLIGLADFKMHAKTGKRIKKQIQQQQIKFAVQTNSQYFKFGKYLD